MQIVLVKKENENLYSSFVSSHPKALIYYELRYRDLLKELLNCEDEYYMLIEEGVVKAILPMVYKDGKYGKVYNSLAYYGSNGSILAENETYYNKLLEKYNEVTKNSSVSVYIENPLDIHEVKPDYDYISERVCQFNIFDKDVNMDDLSKLYTSNKRNDIRKAIKNDVNVVIDMSDEAKEFLFDIHVDNMNAIGGLHKHKKAFELFYQKYEAGKDYNIFIAKKDNTKIAALLLFYYNNVTEYYTPVIANQYREYQPLAVLIHEAVKYSVSNDFLYWNWGGNGIGLSSVYKFKQRWGAKDYFYNYYIKVNDNNFLNLTSQMVLDEYQGFFTIPFNILSEKRGV